MAASTSKTKRKGNQPLPQPIGSTLIGLSGWPAGITPLEELPIEIQRLSDDLIETYRRVVPNQDVPHEDGISRGLQIWDDKMIRDILLPKKRPLARHLSLPIGTFSKDLPKSTNARRLGRRRSRPWAPRPERRQGQAAFLKACFDTKTKQVSWFWSDCFGKGADVKHININNVNDEAIPLAKAQAAAIWYHDQVNKSWLWNVAVLCLRERIIRRGHEAHFPGCFQEEDRSSLPAVENLSILEDLLFLRPEALSNSALDAEVRDALENEDELRHIVRQLKGI
ncbi:hypothetical protein HJFPF1_02094 [Paramyrothecium foliicola]|nr:hypothetical protein HJFPF1_02094 [Paramyrothecium foliicola]